MTLSYTRAPMFALLHQRLFRSRQKISLVVGVCVAALLASTFAQGKHAFAHINDIDQGQFVAELVDFSSLDQSQSDSNHSGHDHGSVGSAELINCLLCFGGSIDSTAAVLALGSITQSWAPARVVALPRPGQPAHPQFQRLSRAPPH